MLIKLEIWARSVAQVEAALFGLTRLALEQLREAAREGRPFPSLYLSGVRYRRERPGKEEWLGPVDVRRRGYGDCEDLVAWYCAQYWLHGDFSVQPHCYAPRPGLVHCVARRSDGRIEDPSRMLGMGGEG